MESETGDRRIKRRTQTRGGLGAIATKTMNNKLDEFLYEELTSEVKYQISALHDVLTKIRASLNAANSEIQGLIIEDEIEDDMERSNDYDSKLALSIQKAMGKLTEANCDQRTFPEEATGSRISTNSGLQNGRLKLPKLDLPKFDGSYSQWASFSDLFNGAKDSSTTLTDPQKLFYFKGLLTGEASRLVASVTVTDANHEVAEEMLKSRYDNRRAIVREHMSKIIHAAPVTKQDPVAVRSLWQGVAEQRRALTALGIQSHEMDIYTIHLVVDKLDTGSRRQRD